MVCSLPRIKVTTFDFSGTLVDTPCSQTICVECDAGTRWIDSKTCEPCLRGYFQHATGKTYCLKCPKHSYCQFPGSTNPQFCARGMYIDYTSASHPDECRTCELGFQYDYKAKICTQCPEGTYRDETVLFCHYCPAGTFWKSSTLCEKCPKGTFKAEEGTGVCSECQPGWYNPDTGKSSCQQCLINYYSDENRLIFSNMTIGCHKFFNENVIFEPF